MRGKFVDYLQRKKVAINEKKSRFLLYMSNEKKFDKSEDYKVVLLRKHLYCLAFSVMFDQTGKHGYKLFL